MNRQQRRRTTNSQPKRLRGKTQAEVLNALMKNGLTPEDIDRSFKEGFDAGFAAASPECTRTMFAAAALALREIYGFGADRCIKVLTAMNNHIINTLDSQDAIDRVFRDLKLEIQLNNPLEPVVKEE